nr:hypothetical protein [Bifidobacterium breve]
MAELLVELFPFGEEKGLVFPFGGVLQNMIGRGWVKGQSERHRSGDAGITILKA